MVYTKYITKIKMSANNRMTQYNKHVVITNIHDRQFKYICDNETGHMNHLKTNPAICEVIGE